MFKINKLKFPSMLKNIDYKKLLSKSVKYLPLLATIIAIILLLTLTDAIDNINLLLSDKLTNIVLKTVYKLYTFEILLTTFNEAPRSKLRGISRIFLRC